MEIKKRKY